MHISDNDQEDALEKLNHKASQRTDEERTAQEEIEAEVFKQIFIPRKLIEVDFPEREIAKAKSGLEDDPVYKSVTGVQLDDVISTSESDSSGESESDQSDESTPFKDSHRPRDESPNSRKERKKAFKADKAEKRKTKVKKHVKKRKEKAASTKKK